MTSPPKAPSWRFLNSGAGEPAWNMAVDEALLESVEELGFPVLRFYAWTEEAATFGYSQRYKDLAEITPLRPLIRRPTGGGLVSHHSDWTYSVVFPPGHFWHRLRAEESYRRTHEWIRKTFCRMGVPSELSPVRRAEAPGQCFIGAEKDDLLWHGRKIAGAAQRRPKSGLLIQGSVQPPPLDLDRGAWEAFMVAEGHEALETPGETWETPDWLAARAEVLREAKYARSDYNQKR